jgi:hypothetical protein
MAIDPTLIVLILLVGTAVVFLVLASRRRAGKVNPNRRFSGAQVALFIGLGVFVITILIGLIALQVVFLYLSVIGLGIVIFALAGLVADMAESKGRSWAAFFWLSILLSPLIMWIVAASVSPFPGSPTFISTGVGPDSIDPADQIKKLSDLQKEGIITKAEFASKKKDLLDRM